LTTLKDVAQHVGVSVQTVSNVVNGRDVVRPKTRDLILRALEELSYHPNLAARGLRHRRSQTLGFLVVDPSPRYLADPFHSEVVTGIGDVAREHGYGLLIQGTLLDEADHLPEILRPFQQKRIDGGVITLAGPPNLRRRYLDQIVSVKQPFVLLEQRISAPNTACIIGEKRRGAFEATEHLIHKGHRNISFLSGTIAWPAIEERMVGYQEALQAHGCSHAQVLMTSCDWTSQAAFDATLELLAAHPEVTAILGANDVLAVGALQAVQSLGRTIPDEVALIGFDDFDFTQYVRPRLTTVRLPGYDMGRRAAELLLEYFQTDCFPQDEVRLPTRLIIRESSQ
jgi:DNA-binding LacI/PurR family transcriptional regulator